MGYEKRLKMYCEVMNQALKIVKNPQGKSLPEIKEAYMVLNKWLTPLEVSIEDFPIQSVLE